MKILKIFVFLLLFPSVVFAGNTYYIDYNAGNDSASGTSKSTPWKHAPGMDYFTGSYSHQAGDHFIFKGGVTWANSTCGCLEITISYSGSQGNPDYYGVDQTWYTGSSWTRPIFDAGGYHTLVSISQQGWIIFEGIEFTGQVATSDTESHSAIHLYDITGDVTFDNIYIHNWNKTAAADMSGTAVIYNNLQNHRGSVILKNSIVYNDDGCGSHPGYRCGNCSWGVDDIINSHLGYCVGVLHGGRIIRDSEFDHFAPSYDSNQHPNVLYIDNWKDQGNGVPSLVYRNRIHDNVSFAGAIYPNPGSGRSGSGPVDMYIYDNLLYNNAQHTNIDIDPYQGTGVVMSVYIWNNTFYIPDASGAIRVTPRTGAPINRLAVQNNHFIGTVASIDCSNTSNCSPQDHNLTQNPAQASSAGYASANNWNAISTSSPTVDKGTPISCTACTDIGLDLAGGSRPNGSAWDIGAYEYGTSVLAAPSNLRIIQ